MHKQDRNQGRADFLIGLLCYFCSQRGLFNPSNFVRLCSPTGSIQYPDWSVLARESRQLPRLAIHALEG